MAVSDYSTTASDNTSISGLTVTDSTVANTLDDIVRQLMADIKAADDANAKTASLGTLAVLNQVGTSQLASGEQMTTANVLAAQAALTAGAVGSLAFAVNVGITAIAFGETVAGSQLRPSNVDATYAATPLEGTWRCLGRSVTNGINEDGQTTLWIRIS